MNAPLSLKSLLQLKQVDHSLELMRKKQLLANKAAATRILLQIKVQLEANDSIVTVSPRKVT